MTTDDVKPISKRNNFILRLKRSTIADIAIDPTQPTTMELNPIHPAFV